MWRNRFFKAAYFAIVLSIGVFVVFIFNNEKRKYDLNDYYFEKMKHSHYTLWNPCKRMITSSAREYAASDISEFREQMLQDGYTKAEIQKMDEQAFNETMQHFENLGDAFWEDLDAKYEHLCT